MMTHDEVTQFRRTLLAVQALCSDMAARIRTQFPVRSQSPDVFVLALQTAGDVWQLDPRDIMSRRRDALILEPRFTLYRWLARRFGVTAAAKLMKRDHAAVVNGMQRLEQWLHHNGRSPLADKVRDFELRLEPEEIKHPQVKERIET